MRKSLNIHKFSEGKINFKEFSNFVMEFKGTTFMYSGKWNSTDEQSQIIKVKFKNSEPTQHSTNIVCMHKLPAEQEYGVIEESRKKYKLYNSQTGELIKNYSFEKKILQSVSFSSKFNFFIFSTQDKFLVLVNKTNGFHIEIKSKIIFRFLECHENV